MIERLTRSCSGFVSFPTFSARIESTNEGGTFVKLVVVDDHDQRDVLHFAKCSGVAVHDLLIETLVADDQCSRPRGSAQFTSVEKLKEEQAEDIAWQQRHFPGTGDPMRTGYESLLSRDYLAVIVMGSTGWTGIDRQTKEPWWCIFDDLTEDGKALCKQIASLYPNASLHLLTFVDT